MDALLCIPVSFLDRCTCKRYLKICPAADRALCSLRHRSQFFQFFLRATADYQELVRVFGTPAQAAENVLNEMDAKQVQQFLKKYQWRRVLAIVLAGLLIACAICLIAYGVFYLYRHFFVVSYIWEGPAVEIDGPLPPTMAK